MKLGTLNDRSHFTLGDSAFPSMNIFIFFHQFDCFCICRRQINLGGFKNIISEDTEEKENFTYLKYFKSNFSFDFLINTDAGPRAL